MLGATAAALALRKHVDLPGIWKDPVPDFDPATEYLVWLNEQRYEEWIIHDRRSKYSYTYYDEPSASSERYFDAHRSDFACLEPGSAKTRNGSKLLHPSSSKRTALGKVVWGGKPMESPENRRVVEK